MPMSWRLYILKLINERHILHTEHKKTFFWVLVCYIIMVSFNNLIAKISSINSFSFWEQLCDKGYVLYCTQIWPRKMRAIFPSLPDSRCHFMCLNSDECRIERKGKDVMSILFLSPRLLVRMQTWWLAIWSVWLEETQGRKSLSHCWFLGAHPSNKFWLLYEKQRNSCLV